MNTFLPSCLPGAGSLRLSLAVGVVECATHTVVTLALLASRR
jgi:hypothetical protein